jgi:hypothetical protein
MAARVQGLLRQAGIQAFLDFDVGSGIPPGRRWECEIYAGVRRSDALVFLVSSASVGSPCCFAEVSLARSLRQPILPILLRPGVQHPLLVDTQWLDIAQADAETLGRWLQQAGLGTGDAITPPDGRPPYPGLRPFAPEDAAFFFGRKPETRSCAGTADSSLAGGPRHRPSPDAPRSPPGYERSPSA